MPAIAVDPETHQLIIGMWLPDTPVEAATWR